MGINGSITSVSLFLLATFMVRRTVDNSLLLHPILHNLTVNIFSSSWENCYIFFIVSIPFPYTHDLYIKMWHSVIIHSQNYHLVAIFVNKAFLKRAIGLPF